MKHLRHVLIANRGEIAVRCIRACRDLSITSVAIFTKADAHSLHVRLADKSVLLQDEGPRAYTDIEAILNICAEQSIDAVLPGYGFLSENVEFSRRVEEASMVFVGPDARVINSMGLKHTARELAIAAGVPVIKGSGLLKGPDEALQEARKLGFPIMLKASGGGGGMGQQICYTETDIAAAFANVDSRSKALFKDAGVFLERYYPKSHHIEVQVFGNGSEVIHFGERECSIQRRHQKVIEECPSPYLRSRQELRDRLTSCAVSLAKLIHYRSAGTVEFLVDDESGEFFFLEMNTRLQVEHGITELCHGVDIVDLMLRQAQCQLQGLGGIPAEEMLDLQIKGNQIQGAAIEVRVCCENPAESFLPCSGVIQELYWPVSEGTRIDTWIQAGTVVSPYFDSLLAKIMVHRSTRQETIEVFQQVLQDVKIGGITTNLTFLESIIISESFYSGNTLTTFLDNQFSFRPQGARVLNPGGLTTIQQPRPRHMKGYGVPPSGPLDDFSAIIANLLVGNARDIECLEIVLVGPELLFLNAAVVALTGAPFSVKVNDVPVEMWSSISIKPKDTLKIETCTSTGARCYLAVRGGFPRVPSWFGTKSTTPSLALGGLQGRQLRRGDYLELKACNENREQVPRKVPSSLISKLNSFETIYVMHGPHDSDDFITASGRQTLYSSSWKIDHNCSRTGIRLIGPKVEWSRVDGGPAGGAHPSNVVDYPYPAPGGVNWTGDSPVIFPSDAPGLGGFLCSSTVPSAELWKLGQLSPGAEIKLTPISYKTARQLASAKEHFIEALEVFVSSGGLPDLTVAEPEIASNDVSDAILDSIPEDEFNPKMTLRQGGDSFIIIDIGFEEVGLYSSVSAELLAKAIRDISGESVFVHVNISSAMAEYDPAHIEQSAVVEMIKMAREKGRAVYKSLPNRRLKLPIVFDHPSIREAEQRYSILQRSKAIYLPDNVTYMKENNALSSREDVFKILRETRFLVVAVGFMIGLPLLFPLDPLARLSGQKYNPTRTVTPPGTVGFGGSVFCIYPADQPGGYMMLARSIPVWDTYGLQPSFRAGTPWLCEPFDVIEFHEVSIDEFEEAMESFEAGTYHLQIEDSTFDVAAELVRERERYDLPEAQEFRCKQTEASERMRIREEELLEEWSAEQQEAQSSDVQDTGDIAGVKVTSPQVGKLWKLNVGVGDRVAVGQAVAVLETMKMEIPVLAEAGHDGLVVKNIKLKEGALVYPGSLIMILDAVEG